MGVNSDSNFYTAEGAGRSTTTGSGSTIEDYVNLAFDVNGAAWNLDQLRAGGATADSFTKALIDIKVNEIIQQPPSEVPFLAAKPLFSVALAGVGLFRHKTRNIT